VTDFNNLPDLKSEAEELRLYLLSGLESADAVIAWADARLVSSAGPQPYLSEISLSVGRKPEDLESLLHAFPGTADREACFRRVFLRIKKLLEDDPASLGRVTQSLYNLALELPPDAKRSIREMLLLRDAYELAEAGVSGTLGEVRDWTMRLLES
jgi:hypothetical protein